MSDISAKLNLLNAGLISGPVDVSFSGSYFDARVAK